MTAFELPVSESTLATWARHCARGDANLADELAQHVRVRYFHGKYEPARGPFKPWAVTCMRNEYVNAHRGLRAVGGAFQLDLPDPDNDPTSIDLAIDLTTPFCAADRAEVFSWTPRPRVVLLGWTGLWLKMHERDQRRTVREAELADACVLPVLRLFTLRDRTHELAAALGVKPNTISQILSRGLARVGHLRFVRELRGA